MKKLTQKLLSLGISIMMLLYPVIALIMRLTFLLAGSALMYIGITGLTSSMMSQLHGDAERIIFPIIMMIGAIAGFLTVIHAMSCSNENLTEPAFC